MAFSLSPNDSQENVVDAVNYLLSNFKGSVSANNTNGQVTGPANQILSYLYKYLAVKYADSFDGQTNFSNLPTNRLYYGLRNTDNSVESTSYQDYVWTQVTGGFGTTKFFFYSVTGGRTIVVQIATTAPSANYVQESGSSIDLDILTVIPSGVVTSVTATTPISSSGGSTPNISLTGVVDINHGGTNSTSTPTAGAVPYGTGTAYGFTAVGTSGQVLASTGSGVPTWSNISSLTSNYFGVPGVDGQDGDDGQIVPGPRGLTGATGLSGPATYLEADYQEAEMFLVPGNQGTAGATGLTGAGGALGYYGSFYDETNQTAASTTVAYVIGIGKQFEANGVSITSSNRISFAYAGTYNIQYSIQFTNSNTGASTIDNADVWLRKNGSDVADSNSIFGVPTSKGGTNGAMIAAVNYVLTVAAGDYLQLAWAVTNTTVSILTTAAQTGPTVPITPGVIVTAQQVMYTQMGPIGPQGFDGEQGEEGPRGPQGLTGVTGAQGSVGPAVYLEAPEADEPMSFPGPTGVQGIQGLPGVAVYLEAPEAEEPIFTGGPTAPVNSSLTWSVPVTKTADFTLGVFDTYVINNKAAATCTVTLPSASGYPGRPVNFQNYQAFTLISASSNVVPIAGGAAGTAILAASIGDTTTLISDGTNWIQVRYNPNNSLLLE
jgi:hypothetical protein